MRINNSIVFLIGVLIQTCGYANDCNDVADKVLVRQEMGGTYLKPAVDVTKIVIEPKETDSPKLRTDVFTKGITTDHPEGIKKILFESEYFSKKITGFKVFDFFHKDMSLIKENTVLENGLAVSLDSNCYITNVECNQKVVSPLSKSSIDFKTCSVKSRDCPNTILILDDLNKDLKNKKITEEEYLNSIPAVNGADAIAATRKRLIKLKETRKICEDYDFAYKHEKPSEFEGIEIKNELPQGVDSTARKKVFY